jgi:predicted secreted protein
MVLQAISCMQKSSSPTETGSQFAMGITITLFLLALLPIILVGCSSPSQVEIDCEAFFENNHLDDEIAVSVVDEFMVMLCSNPSTGYQWSEDAEIADNEVVKQVDHEFLMPAELDPPPPPGTPGVEVWTLSALVRGSTTIDFDYSRPWEGGEKSTWTFRLNVAME